MKKVLVLFATLAAAVYVASWFWAGDGDGRWTFDGTTLRFAKPVPLPKRRDTSLPLTLRVRE